MAYADYEFYTNTYMGTAITEEAFPRLALRASSFLDYYTQGRAARNADLQALKMACCAVAEQWQVIDSAENAVQNAAISAAPGGELQSQTVGDWSQTYRSSGSAAAEALGVKTAVRKTLAEAAAMYLMGTGLLYRGGCR